MATTRRKSGEPRCRLQLHREKGTRYDYLLATTPDPSQLFVFADGNRLARDSSHANGWDYDAANNQVVVYGASCSHITAGTVTKVQIVYGCLLN